MTLNRGATHAALERWNERRRRIFYPKTGLDFDLEALRKRKAELSKIDLSKIANILDQEIRSIDFLPDAGTFHALFRVRAAERNWILKLSPDDIAPGFALETVVMTALKLRSLPSLEVAAVEATGQTFPCPCILIEEAAGQTLTSFENPESQA